VFQMDDAQQLAVSRDRERRATGFCDAFGEIEEAAGRLGTDSFDCSSSGITRRDGETVGSTDVAEDRINRAFAEGMPVEIDAADAGLSRKGDEGRVVWTKLSTAQTVFLLRQHDDGTALRCLVGERGKLCRVSEFAFIDARQRQKLRRLAVAECDGA